MGRLVVVAVAVVLIGYMAPAVFAWTDWFEEGLDALKAGDYDKAIRDFTLTLEVFPEDYEALSSRGVAWFYTAVYDRALQDATRALEINPYYTIGANQLAWMLATCPDPQYRDGKKAVALAETVVDRFPEANFMDTLAAAYAEAGNMEAAVKIQRLAVERLRGEMAVSDTASFEKRLNAYGQSVVAGKNGEMTDVREPIPGAGGGVEPGGRPSTRDASSLAPSAPPLSAAVSVPPMDEKNEKDARLSAENGQRFSVHLFSLRRETLALENAASLAKGPHPVFVHSTLVKNDTIPWYRIYVGAFDSRQAAQDHAGTLKQAGHDWTHVIILPAGLTPVTP
jgi:tetratricopeptide (TPR) repeat protein